MVSLDGSQANPRVDSHHLTQLPTAQPADYVLIASISYSDEDSFKVIREILANNNIQYDLYSSLGLHVLVQRANFRGAQQLLIADMRLKDRRIYFPPLR